MTSTLTSLPLAGIPPEDEALRAEVRGWLTQALRDVPADVRSRSWLGYDLAFSRALARQGWIGLTLPRIARVDIVFCIGMSEPDTGRRRTGPGPAG